MAFKKQSLPIGQLEHVRDNVYRKRFIYKEKYHCRYFYKTNCQVCGKETYQEKNNADKGSLPVCSKQCHYKNNASKTIVGIKYKSSGYVLVYKPNHPYAYKSYVLEHRLIIEEQIKRYLLPEEKVHHINLVKDDNRIENLIIFNNTQEHSDMHKSADLCFKDLIDNGIIVFNIQNKRYEIIMLKQC